MASFKIEDLLKTAGFDPTSSQPSQSETIQARKTRVGQRPGRSIQETKDLIKKFVEDTGRPVLIPEICIYLERVQTPHIRKILHDMAEAGELVEQADLARSRTMVRYWYSLP